MYLNQNLDLDLDLVAGRKSGFLTVDGVVPESGPDWRENLIVRPVRLRELVYSTLLYLYLMKAP